MSDLIADSDLRVTCERPNPGGQHVGVYTGVRVEHLPTGIIAEVNTDYSQHRNRAIAFDMIEAALTSRHYR